MTIQEMNELGELKDKGAITPEFYSAMINSVDTWVPACGGNETWTLAKSGAAFLYVYNPKTREHGWLNQSDIVEMVSPYEVR